jgi:hypothetical protein
MAREVQRLTTFSHLRLTTRPHRVNPPASYLCRDATPEEERHQKELSGIHFQTRVHFYANESAVLAIKSDSTNYPAGSILIKEKLGPKEEVTSIAGMIKRTPGYNANHGDWEYFYFEKSGKLSAGKIESCIRCHQAAKSSDRVFSLSDFLE